MKKVAILPNVQKDKGLETTKRLVKYLVEKGCEPQLSRTVAELAEMPQYAMEDAELYSHSDLLISLGGDGTLLGIGRRTARFNKPILGINLGTLGFLTAEEKTHAEEAINKVLNGEFKLEKRMMLECSIAKDNERTGGIIALNDICITRGNLYKILEFRVYVNNEYVDTLLADGVIICTPTGSTAYSLSVGGPVVDPMCRCFILSPLAPHNLTMRPVVVPDSVAIELQLMSRGSDAFISLDNRTFRLKDGAKIRICLAEEQLILATSHNNTFYDTLRNKMMWGIDPR